MCTTAHGAPNGAPRLFKETPMTKKTPKLVKQAKPPKRSRAAKPANQVTPAKRSNPAKPTGKTYIVYGADEYAKPRAARFSADDPDLLAKAVGHRSA